MVDKTLAGNGNLGTFSPVQLFAGEADVVTSRITFKTGLVFAQFEPFAIDAAGKAVKLDPAAADVAVAGGAVGQTTPAPETKARGITLHAMDTSGTGYNADKMGPYYKGGIFNHEALVWPAALDTLAKRQAAFAGGGNHNINIERLL